MNQPNDEFEDSLRRYFEKFNEEYDADEPSDKVWLQINQEIQPIPSPLRKYGKWALGLLLLITLNIAVFFSADIALKQTTKNRMNGQSTISVKQEVISVNKQNVHLRKSISDTKVDISKNESKSANNILVEVSESEHNHNKNIVNTLPEKFDNQSNKVSKKQAKSSKLAIKNNINTNIENQRLYIKNTEHTNVNMSAVPRPITLSTTPSTHVNSITNQSEITLSALASKNLKVSQNKLSIPSIEYKAYNNSTHRKELDTSRLSWSIAVQPFQTYQYLTNHISTTDFKLVALHIPTILNSTRMGWQIQISAQSYQTKRLSWRASGFYRRMPQFTNYEIATNEFIVKEVALIRY